MGSGSVSAYGELETGYRDDLTIEGARDLAVKAIKAGILYDLGSGSNVDFVILKKGKTEHFRNYEIVGTKLIQKCIPYQFPKNNIPILSEVEVKVQEMNLHKEQNTGMIIEDN